MQTLELEILNWIQSHLRCGILDAAMPAVSWICNHGEVWILLAAVLAGDPENPERQGRVWPAGWRWICCCATSG